MTRVPINGVHLNVEVVGRGPPLLALHGFTEDLHTWDDLVAAARDICTLILVDLLGHGGSDAPESPERYGMAHTVADLVGVLDALGVERACWLGYSMGGRIALMAALTAPERCLALVLEGASPGLADPEERARRRQSDEALARWIEAQGVGPFVDYWERLPLFATRVRLPQERRQALRARRLRNRPVGLANTLRGLGVGAQEPVHHRLTQLQMPVLLIVGAEDAKFRDIAAAMLQALSWGRLVVIPEAGHAPHLEQPHVFNQTVVRFLADLFPEGGGDGAP